MEEASALIVLAVAGIGAVVRDFETGAYVWNETAFEIFGLPPAGRPPEYDALPPGVHPEDADALARYIEDRRTAAYSFDYEYRVLTPCGESKTVRETGRYQRGPDGRPLRYYGALRDVTVEKRRAAELDKSRMRLKLALESNDMAVWEYNRATGESTWSPEYYRLLGYEPGAVPAGRQSWLAAVHPDDRAWARALSDDMRYSGTAAEMTYRVVAHGRERWVRDTWNWPRTGANPSDICYGLTADITDWTLREHRLGAAERWLDLAVEAGGMGLWDQGFSGSGFRWNEQMFRLLGLSPAETVPSTAAWYGRIHPADRKRVLETLQHAVATGGGHRLEYRILLPGGGERWVEERGRRAADASGLRQHGVLFDISERKAREEYLLASQRLEASGQLLGGLVHDFNNLLSVIAAALERVEAVSCDPEAIALVTQAREAAMSGALFNRRLINLSRQRSGSSERLNVNSRIAGILGAMRSILRRDISLEMGLEAGVWAVEADPLDLESAVLNLVVNARDAIQGRGSITITTRNRAPGACPRLAASEDGDYVALSVRDTGCGMDAATLARATEPFFTTKAAGAGTGLGLTSVAAFVRQAKGHLFIDSRAGQGTEVLLYIPRAPDLAPVHVPDDAPLGDGQRILVVDDDPGLRELTMQRVEALGYAVEEAVSAEDAKAKLAAGGIDLVLSDLWMPGGASGQDLRHWAQDHARGVPVLLITGTPPGVDAGRDALPRDLPRRNLARAIAAALTAAADAPSQ